MLFGNAGLRASAHTFQSNARQRFTPCDRPAFLRPVRRQAPVRQQQQQQQQQKGVFSRSRQPLWCASSSLIPDAIPADVKLEVDPNAAAKQATYDEATKTVRIPLAAVNDGQRRTKMVMFTCNKCGGRSARLVNPLAWEKGAVFAQCQHCDVWHTLAAAPHIIEEVRYKDPQPAATTAAGSDAEESQQSSSTAADDGSDTAADEEVASAAKQQADQP